LFQAIIDENQVMVMEDINVKGLVQSRLAKSIADSGMVQADFHSGRPLLTVLKALPPMRVQKRRLGTT
jgi:hypothetical protein